MRKLLIEMAVAKNPDKYLSHVITQIGMFTSVLQKSMKVKVRRKLVSSRHSRGCGRVRSNVRLRSRWNLVSIVIRRMPEERSLKSFYVYIHSARFAPRRVSITPPAFAKILQKANVNSWIMKIEGKENNIPRILSATRARKLCGFRRKNISSRSTCTYA